MGTTGPITPPFPTSDPTPSTDPAPTAQSTPAQDQEARIQALIAHANEIAAAMGVMHKASGILERSAATFIQSLQYIPLFFATIEASVTETWVSNEARWYAASVPALTDAANLEAAEAIALLAAGMSGDPTLGPSFIEGPLSQVAQEMFNTILQPFTLLGTGIDPSQLGSGVKAQQYLLSKALSLMLQEWIVEQLGTHTGMGYFKSLMPFLGIIDNSLNPSNVVRQAVDASYATLLKTPLARDLNNAYPIKKLGATVLAKTFIRKAIDENEYLRQCLDLGLSNDEARNLLATTVTMPDRDDIATLLRHGYLTEQHARDALAIHGYDESMVDAIIYLDTHKRYFALQESVANAIRAEWKAGKIDTPSLEQILQRLGYTQDEITLAELEDRHSRGKSLTYAQIKEMFAKNIVGLNDVIDFLTNEGYSQEDTNKLILLDFTEAAERVVRQNTLIARLRVEAETALSQTEAETKKHETALAAAKQTLAAQLKKAADELGQLQTQPGIIGSLGSL